MADESMLLNEPSAGIDDLLDSSTEDMCVDFISNPRRNLSNDFEYASNTKTFEAGFAVPHDSNAKAMFAQRTHDKAIVSSSNSLPVFLRLRPSYAKDRRLAYCTVKVLSSTQIQTVAPASVQVKHSTATYDFSHVYQETVSQEEIFRETSMPLVRKVVDRGQSGLIFCYGITNAGKTHTILGDLKDSQSWGIVPRALQDVCASANGKQLTIAYFELYNEQIHDLLSKTQTNTSLKVRERNGEAVIQGLSQHPITSLEQGMNLVKLAKQQRRTASNNLNRDSSRSHCICQIQVECACLWIVDLAGSERTKRTNNGVAGQKEASHINLSLMTLMQCMKGMREAQKNNMAPVIPYRNSKLTTLFMKHFMGPFGANTAMIVNANPAAADYSETQHVLGNAAASKDMEMKKMEVAVSKGPRWDKDGRRIEPNNSKFATKARNFVKKLSPKLTFKRKTLPKDEEVLEPKAKKIKSEEMTNVPSEAVIVLEARLARALAENEVLSTKIDELQSTLDDIEHEVRTEVASELEEQMRTMQQQYESVIDSFKIQADLQSNHKFQDKRATLKEKIEECEEEMERMREEHIIALQTAQQQHLHELKMQTDSYEKKMNDLRAEMARVEESKRAAIASYEKLLREAEEEKDEEALDSDDESSDENVTEENVEEFKEVESTIVAESEEDESQSSRRRTRVTRAARATEETSGSRSTRRMTRRLTKKVAKNLTDVAESLRPPFGAVDENAGDSSSDEGSFGPDKWLRPRKETKPNPRTGLHPRPRGRKPSNVTDWDASRGMWRLKE